MFHPSLLAVDIPPSQVNILDGNANDLVAECHAYEERIKAMGGIELFLAGIGEDGHIAFNEPGKSYSALVADTLLIQVHQDRHCPLALASRRLLTTPFLPTRVSSTTTPLPSRTWR